LQKLDDTDVTGHSQIRIAGHRAAGITPAPTLRRVQTLAADPPLRSPRYSARQRSIQYATCRPSLCWQPQGQYSTGCDVSSNLCGRSYASSSREPRYDHSPYWPVARSGLAGFLEPPSSDACNSTTAGAKTHGLQASPGHSRHRGTDVPARDRSARHLLGDHHLVATIKRKLSV
jgi:hypothetical protein